MADPFGAVWTAILHCVSPFQAEEFWKWTAGAALIFASAFFRTRSLRSGRLWHFADSCLLAGLAATIVASVSASLLDPQPALSGLQTICFLALLAAFGFAFLESAQARLLQRPAGLVAGEVAITTGAICASYAFSSGNQRSGYVAIATTLLGAVLVVLRVMVYLRGREEHRILEHQAERGVKVQPEYTGPSPECPEPQLWSMYDSMTAEVEVLDLIRSIVLALKPELVVETGAFAGVSSLRIADALRDNGRGRLLTCEMDPKVYEAAMARFRGSPLAALVDCRCCASLDLKVDGRIDLLYCDSDLAVREAEVRHFLPQMNPFGLILMHDAGSRFPVVREGAFRMEAEGLISVVAVSTPRGLVIAQRREGRR
jgi:predicted O-methyltransferase YrrM